MCTVWSRRLGIALMTLLLSAIVACESGKAPEATPTGAGEAKVDDDREEAATGERPTSAPLHKFEAPEPESAEAEREKLELELGSLGMRSRHRGAKAERRAATPPLEVAPEPKQVRSAPRAARASPSPLRARSPAKSSLRPTPLTEKQRAENRRAAAREHALARAEAKDAERQRAARAPLAPHYDEEEPFAEIRVLDKPSVRNMTFYDYGVNPTISTKEERVSTFAVDVDSASYGVVRSYLQKGTMPDEAAVRVEEMINAFDYAYAAPDKEPFLVQAEAFPSPNRKGYHVLHVGIKGRELSIAERKPAALVFVVDVSGSMQGADRLGLVKRSLTMLTRQLDGRDAVSIVVYGSTARTVLEPTRTTENGKRRVIDTIAGLSTEGSTNVQAGLELGYDIAARHVNAGATTRVILCSDGVANVGSTRAESILRGVEKQTRRGVTISTVGFGMGNYNDVLMERLADKGNGNYAYVDNIEAAQRVFVEQLGATLEVIAKDVKVQVVFDDGRVARYRLVGFENRMLDKRDFADDRVDAGEIGAGHTVTAIYEIKLRAPGGRGKLGALRIRYKRPSGGPSHLLQKEMPMSIVQSSYAKASAPTKLSMVVAAFAEKLRGSYWSRNQSYEDILGLWQKIPDSLRRRQDVAELRSLIVTASSLDSRGDRFADLLPVAKMDFDHVPVLY